MREAGKMRMVVAVAALLGIAAFASATTVINDFSNFNLSGTYGSWAAPTTVITSGPTSYRVQAVSQFGGGYYDIDPNINAAGETTVEVTFTFNPENMPNGLVVTLVDDDLSTYNYAWYGLPNGTQTISKALNAPNWVSDPGATPGLDLANLSFFHIQIDPLGATDVSWDHLALTPEPAALVLLALGGVVALRRRGA